MTLDEFVATAQEQEDPAELHQFAAFIREGEARDPDSVLATTPEGWRV